MRRRAERSAVPQAWLQSGRGAGVDSKYQGTRMRRDAERSAVPQGTNMEAKVGETVRHNVGGNGETRALKIGNSSRGSHPGAKAQSNFASRGNHWTRREDETPSIQTPLSDRPDHQKVDKLPRILHPSPEEGS